MHLTEINCDLLICFPLSLPYSSHKPQPCTLATVHRKKFTQNFVAHVTKVFSDESSCEVKIKKNLVLNSYDNGTVEMSDVHLTLPPPPLLSVVVQTVQLKHDFCCRSERIFLFICKNKIKIRCN